MKISGARQVVEALKKENVDVIFGYPGGVVIPIFDVLYSEPDIRVVLTRHEQGAAHAADGYARSTGKVGVLLVTSGPGATNTVTGLATANFDSIPLVCITGQVSRDMIGNDAFQEADTVGITRPVTKHNFLVTRREGLGKTLREAFFIARTGRPGPVVVDIPKDIFLSEAEEDYPEEISIRGYSPVLKGHKGQIRRAAQAVNQAQKPLFFVGGGVHISGAVDVFREIVSKTGCPVVSSLMGIGVLPGDDPANLGMIGMHGTYAANMAVSDCDLLFGIGVRFDDRATGDLAKFAPEARIIHVDIDPTSISRNVPVEIPIVGDAKTILEEFLPLLRKTGSDSWKKTLEAWKVEKPVPKITGVKHLSPSFVIEAIHDEFPEAVIASEVGQNQMWTALYYCFRGSRQWLTSGGLGTMGYGFPASIGAQVGCPDKRVIDIAGDGSFQMNIQELATAVQERLPLIVAILNNGFLGMVRQWQELFQEGRYSSTCLLPGGNKRENGKAYSHEEYVPDFMKIAEAYGAYGMRAKTEEDVRRVLAEAKEINDRPVVIDFHIEPEVNVWPMVPPGAGLREMIFEWKEEKK